MDEKPVILIVDPVDEDRAVLSRFFQEDYETLEVTDANAALAVLGSQRVNLVLLELEMQGMDVMDLMSVMKHAPGMNEIPVMHSR